VIPGPFLEALSFQAGHNATVVVLGASLLGAAAGVVGTFLLLRKRALVSDAMAHATLPGVGIAFLIAVSLGFDGRNLALLLAGSALSAGVGLLAIDWITRRSRLSEDAAIASVLSVFFGFGVVLLTLIQSLPTGKKAGLQGLLLGSTAGMLSIEAVIVLIGAAVVAAAVFALRRPFTLVAFDPAHAEAAGVPIGRTDLLLMAVALGVVVVGLKVVGLILVVALLIIPAVTARLWTDRIDRMTRGAALLGALAAYVGVSLSAAYPRLPTGAMIVLVSAGLFAFSLLAAPRRGLMARALERRRVHADVHLRQGLLALARREPILDPVTLAVLRRGGLIRGDRTATEEGRAQAAKILRDEKRWEIARAMHPEVGLSPRYLGLEPIEQVLSRDEIAVIDARIGPPRDAAAGAA
jgi:manganese/zinc/iron transport system permease protein